MITFADLPPDILYTIFPYLTAFEFLNFTSSTKTLLSYHQDPTFWRTLTRATFRIPPQPLLQADGARWQWLYKNLATQTQLFTWGNSDKGSLGPQSEIENGGLQFTTGRRLGRHVSSTGKRSGWPARVKIGDIDENVGVVADVQCGGWSTTILNSIGVIYAFGVFNGLTFNHAGGEDLKKLNFPPAYPPTTNERYEPSTAIRQYSTGRSHVLGLADDGKVWMWTNQTAFLVKPLHVDVEGQVVKRVVAGWDRGSAFVANVGIVHWDSGLTVDLEEGTTDALLIEATTIPGTGYRRSRNSRTSSPTLESHIGEVTNHIVLEGYIVFTTSLNKLFCYPTSLEPSDHEHRSPIELTTFYPTDPDSASFEIRDLQGSYRNFAIFTKSGSVLTASCALLNAFHTSSSSPSPETRALPQPTRIPSLQSQSIISLAFGDHHSHTLHANGHISSHGTDSQCCGAFGLGHRFLAQLRGVRFDHITGNGTIPPETVSGRTVWFEPLMEKWLTHMWTVSRDMLLHLPSAVPETWWAIGDYFEREGARWEDGVTEAGEMPAYFALKVSAAGWHSAALVLVDEEKAERARQNHIIPPPPSPLEPPPGPTSENPEARNEGERDREREREGPRDGRGNVSEEEEEDHWGGTWEDIDSPWEQLANTFFSILDFVYWLGRWFLGLTARDATRDATIAAQAQLRDGGGAGGRQGVPDGPAALGEALLGGPWDVVQYVWSGKQFPEIRVGEGNVVEVVDRDGDDAARA